MERADLRGRSLAIAGIVFYSFFHPNIGVAQVEHTQTGPVGFIAVGPAGPVEYRDIFLDDRPSLIAAGGISFKGLSLSGWLGQDLNSGSKSARELLATYSYKAPLLDIHLGTAHCRLYGRIRQCADSLRITVESNFAKTQSGGFTFNHGWRTSDKSWTLFGQRVLFQKQDLRVVSRVSLSRLNYANVKGDGVSFKIIAVREISSAIAIHAGLGINSSRVSQGLENHRKTTPLVTFNTVWFVNSSK